MGFMHQELIEILSYAMVITVYKYIIMSYLFIYYTLLIPMYLIKHLILSEKPHLHIRSFWHKCCCNQRRIKSWTPRIAHCNLTSKLEKTTSRKPRITFKSKKISFYSKNYLFTLAEVDVFSQVKNVIEKPHNDHLPLIEASRFELLLKRTTF